MKPAARSNIHVWEILAWTLLALIAAVTMHTLRPMPLSSDSYQYLSVAENITERQQLATSLVHFDTERSHGRVPAPITTFPPGYALTIAAASTISGDLEGAGRLVSGIGYAGTAAMLAWALITTGVATFVRQVILVLFVTNAVALHYQTAVLSESLYMLLSTSAVAVLIWAEQRPLPPRSIFVRAAIGFTLAGLAYWVRYAGLFLIAAVIAYAFLQLVVERTRLRAEGSMAALISVALAGAAMLRNVATVGTWKGGNDLTVSNPFGEIAAEYVRAQLHLLLGRHALMFGVWEVLLIAGGMVACGALAYAALHRGSAEQTHLAPAMLVIVCIAVYSAGMFYAGLRTVISFGTRMFLPVLPLYLLIIGMAVTWVAARRHGAQRVALNTALVLVAAGYVGTNARDLYEPVPPAAHEVLATLYAQPAENGRPLAEWIQSHVPKDGAIVADEGQATGHVLDRPVISMIGSHYSSTRWECDEVKEQMARFGSRYVMLYKPSAKLPDKLLPGESRFAAASVSGQPLCGFVVATENPYVRILEVGSPAEVRK